MEKIKAIVCLSGGVDSAVVLANAIKWNRDIIAISFYYGSKHNPFELEAAKNLARHYQISWCRVDITGAFALMVSNLLSHDESGEIPEGHYEDKSMSQTVVPARNMVFASILTGIAASRQINEIYLGVHSGDHHIYPDCRPTFINAMNLAIRTSLGLDGRKNKKNYVRLLTPYIHHDKAYIVKEGIKLHVPFELTRTCYTAQEIACGKCGSCIERLGAFEKNGIKDPIRYQTA